MRLFVLFAAAALALTGFAFAAVDPTVPTPELQAVVSKCQVVADNIDKDGSNTLKGQCIGSTQSYLDALRALDPALDEATFNQDITDLVLALVPLAQDDTCDEFDDEIARAVRLASSYSTSPDQVAQLQQISDTVAACESDTTGALSSEPASPNA